MRKRKFNRSTLEAKLSRAAKYLKTIGCKEIILFGSLADDSAGEFSDIDLAVSGISPRIYFKTVAEISSVVGCKVDLVAIDYISQDFREKIRREGRPLYAR